jgi:hypothetical protein
VPLPLLATLALLSQTPGSTGSPLSVLIAPPEAAGVPSHIVSFAQEHLYEEFKADGFQVVRSSELAQGLPPAQRKQVLGCNRLEAACRVMLGEAAVTDVVMIAELVQFLSGYRVGLKAYDTRDGALIAEHYVPGVPEDQLLDAFTQASDKVLPAVVHKLRPESARPTTQKPAVTTAPPSVSGKPGDAPVVVPPGGPTVAEQRKGGAGWAWVPAAGGVVLAGVGTYFFVQAGKDYTALKNDQFTDGQAAANLRDAGQRKQWLSAGAFALGAVGVVTTGILYLSSSGDKGAGLHPTAALGKTGGMVGVVGTLP